MTDPAPRPPRNKPADRIPPRPRPRRALQRTWRELTVPLGTGDTAALSPLRALATRALTTWRVGAD